MGYGVPAGTEPYSRPYLSAKGIRDIASGLFAALQDSLNTVWHVEDQKRSIWQTVRDKISSLGMLLVMVRTPIVLHSGSFEQHARTAGRVARTVVVTMATGGAGGAASAGAGSSTASLQDTRPGGPAAAGAA